MSGHEFHLHGGKTGAAITVSVIPGSKRNEISEILDDGTLNVRLIGTSTRDKANQDLILFLAEVLDIDKTQLEIVAGLSGSDKLITIIDLDKNQVQERIVKHLA